MENRIDILNPVDRSKLKAKDYFRTLVSEGTEKQLLTEFDTEKIQTGLIETLYGICSALCEKGNSSMRTEDAEEIASSVMYTLSVILKKSPTPESAIERLKNESIENLFQEGRMSLVSLITRARGKWAVINKALFETENVYYSSTLNDGMKAFFANYNYETASHKNVITCDYPLCIDLREEDGIEFIYNYLCNFKYENDFLNKFSAENIHSLMLCLDTDLKRAGFPFEEGAYRNLPLNIFIYVFSEVLALEFCSKDIYSLNLNERDIKELTKELDGKSYTETVSLFDRLTDRICVSISADEELQDYLKKCVRVIVSEITSVKEKTLTGVFLYSKNGDDSFFEADKTERLSDSEYRFIISQILSSEDKERRISLLKENIKNAFDFAEAVKDLSLTRAEIFSYLMSADLGENLRLFKRYNVFSFCLSDEDKPLKEILEIYISSLQGKTKDNIIKMLSLMK